MDTVTGPMTLPRYGIERRHGCPELLRAPSGVLQRRVGQDQDELLLAQTVFQKPAQLPQHGVAAFVAEDVVLLLAWR